MFCLFPLSTWHSPSYSLVSASCTVQVQSAPTGLKHLPGREISLFFCSFTLLFFPHVLQLVGQHFSYCFIYDLTVFSSVVFLSEGKNIKWLHTLGCILGAQFGFKMTCSKQVGPQKVNRLVIAGSTPQP